MDFLDLVKQRESIRSYNINKPLSQEQLKYILEAGRLAPSAANRQAWEFILVSSEEWLNKIRPCYHREWFHQAPHILIIKGNKSKSWQRSDGYNSIETDLTIAMDHMILAASSIGVGTCWIAAFDYKILSEALSLNENEEVFAITPLGFPNEELAKKEKNRKSFDEVVTFL